MPYAGSRPYGDNFLVSTSAADNMAARLYAEHNQRQAQQQKDLQDLDGMFAKNVAGVRDEDVSELSDAYSQYKAAKIGLYKNNKLKGQDRINADMEAQRKLANVYQLINDSKQAKKQLEDNGKLVAAKPDSYLDNAASILSSTNGVPTRKLKNGLVIPSTEIDKATGLPKSNTYNPFDISNLQDRGNVQDWMPIIMKAKGTPKEVGVIEKELKGTDGIVLGKEVTSIKAGVSPADYFTNMAASMAGTGRSKHFNNTFSQAFDEGRAEEVMALYEELKKDPVAQKAWGEQGLNIPASALLNPATRTLALSSMAYALTNQPALGKPSNVTDLSGKRAADMADFNAKEKVRNKNITNRMYLRSKLGLDAPTVDRGVSFDEFGDSEAVEVYNYKKNLADKMVGGRGDKQTAGKIDGGIVYGTDGKPMESGSVIVSSDKVPSSVIAAGVAGGIIDKKLGLPNEVKLTIKNGEIQAISGDGLNPVSRDNIYIFQKKLDTERKGEGLKFGKDKKGTATKPVKPTKDNPLGLDFNN